MLTVNHMSLWVHSYRPAVKSTPCGTSHNKREKMSSSRTLTCGRTDESWVWSDESKCASAFVISCGCRTPYDDIYRFLSIYCHLDVLLISESLIQTTCCFITTTQLRPGAERSCLRSRPDEWFELWSSCIPISIKNLEFESKATGLFSFKTLTECW